MHSQFWRWGLMFAVPLLAGCAEGAKQEYREISQTEEFQTAKTVWNVASFAANATNPVYYATKGAMIGYDKYKEHKEAKQDEPSATE